MGKTHFALGFIFGVLISLAAVTLYSFNRPNYEQIAREQSAEIAQLKLENDTLKHSVWYEAQWTMENGD
jgi:hypothetical protein